MKKKYKITLIVLSIVAILCLVFLVWGNILLGKYKCEVIPKEAWNSLYHPLEMTLFSIEPNERFKPTDKDIMFQGYHALGSIIIQNQEEQKSIATEIENGVINADNSNFKCFNPRHGVRVNDGKATYDFLICYQCNQMEVYKDGASIAFAHIKESHNLFNEILKKANIPLPPSP